MVSLMKLFVVILMKRPANKTDNTPHDMQIIYVICISVVFFIGSAQYKKAACICKLLSESVSVFSFILVVMFIKKYLAANKLRLLLHPVLYLNSASAAAVTFRQFIVRQLYSARLYN